MQHRTIYALCSLKYFLLINWVYTDLTSRISPTTIICSLRLHWQVNFDYTFRFTPTTLSDSLQIHSFVHSAYTSKLTLTTSLCLLRLQLLVHSDLAILEPFFSITPVGRFWLVKTSIWMTPFRFESSCARDGGMWWIILHRGDHIWSFFRRGAGIYFYHESYCDERGIMTIYGFLNIQILCDVNSGVELCPYYMGNGCVYGLIWECRNAAVF
jgi:hypothetical protein